jgi:hypothetical protein
METFRTFHSLTYLPLFLPVFSYLPMLVGLSPHHARCADDTMLMHDYIARTIRRKPRLRVPGRLDRRLSLG